MIGTMVDIFRWVRDELGYHAACTAVLAAGLVTLSIYVLMNVSELKGATQGSQPSKSEVAPLTEEDIDRLIQSTPSRFEKWFLGDNAQCQIEPSRCGFQIVAYGRRPCSDLALHIPTTLRRSDLDLEFAYQEIACRQRLRYELGEPGSRPFSIIFGDLAYSFESVQELMQAVLEAPENADLRGQNGIDYYVTTPNAALAFRAKVQINVRRRAIFNGRSRRRRGKQ